MDSLIYEDKAYHDIWLKVVLALPLAIFFIWGLYLATSEPETAKGLFFTAVFIAIILWTILPRKYCILDSKVKVVLGGSLSFSIPFDTIEIARIPKGTTVGINLVTSFSSKNAVQIVRKRRLNVNITPSNRELFLENLDRTLNRWRSYNTQAR